VFVCLATSWEFFDAWFGALLAGARPVTVAPPGTIGTSEHQLHALARLTERFEPVVVVAGQATRDRMREVEPEAAERILTPEELAAVDTVAALPDPPDDPEELAFFQLTSGSTGTPRAVAISHRAILACLAAIRDAVIAPHYADVPPGAATTISWLPLHHDMGLVGMLLYAVAGGQDIRFISPRSFLGRPQSWMQAIAGVPHAFTAGPNFAYQTCVERVKPKHLQDLTLSGWHVALTGAEMIRPGTSRQFEDAFTASGFRPAIWAPSYGMAETTLTVTVDRSRRGVRTRPLPAGAEGLLNSGEVVSVGTPVLGMEVRVAAPDGTGAAAGAVGEVQARGALLFSGYHLDPEATAEVMTDGWLRTGDLGFLADGELYITGRLKDLIIVHGHNVMPHELEWIAEHASGGGGTRRAGAFSVDDGGSSEEPVLVVEAGTTDGAGLAELAAAIRKQTMRALGLALRDVAFVRRGSLPKTSSGKVQRRELRRRYLARGMERLDVDS